MVSYTSRQPSHNREDILQRLAEGYVPSICGTSQYKGDLIDMAAFYKSVVSEPVMSVIYKGLSFSLWPLLTARG